MPEDSIDHTQSNMTDTYPSTIEAEPPMSIQSNDSEDYSYVPIPNEAADWIMLFGDETVFASELIFVASIMGLDPVVHQEIALNQLIEFMAIINRANRHGIGITQEEREEILPVAHMTVGMMGLSGIVCDERLVDFFEVGNLLTRLLDHYVTDINFEVTGNEPEFLAFAEANRNFLANIELQYIINQDIGLVQELHENFLSGGVQFSDLAAEYSIFHDAGDDAIVYSIQLFEDIFLMYDHDRNALYQLQTGELSHVFNIEEFFFLVYIHSRTEATDAEIEAAYINERVMARRAEAIAGLVNDWVAEAVYILNHDILDAMR